MTGPQHYEEAERLLTIGAPNRGSTFDQACIQAAQAHATLAHAAAMALTVGHEDDVADTLRAWHEVAGEAQR